MRLKVLVSVIVVICCGLAVRYLASRSQERKGQPAEAKVKVLVAKQKISPWVPIKEPEKFNRAARDALTETWSSWFTLSCGGENASSRSDVVAWCGPRCLPRWRQNPD